MGNLLACCPAPRRGSCSETRSGKTPMENWICDGYEPLRLSPSTFTLAATLAISPCRGCDDSNSAPEFRGNIENASLNLVKQQQKFSCLRQQSFINSSEKKKKKKVTFDPNVVALEASSSFKDDAPMLEKDGDYEKVNKGKALQIVDKIPTHPAEHRCQNCSQSYHVDDEKDDTFYDPNDENYHDGAGGYHQQEEESSDSLFSLQLDKDWQTFSEVDSAKSKSTPSSDESVPSGNLSVCERDDRHKNVLKPVENLSLLREVKEMKASARHLDKENIDQSLETKVLSGMGKPTKRSVDSSCDSQVCKGDDTCIDASFSSWLQIPHKNSSTGVRGKGGFQSSGCFGSYTSSAPDDHPISSALLVDNVEIRKLQSNKNLPERYLELTGQVGKLNFSTTRSGKCEKDKIINRHSIHSI